MPETPDPKIHPATPAAPPPVRGTSRWAYAELDVTTNFSFLRGASHPDELVYRAAELGHAAIAVTDINTVAGVVRAHQAAKQANIRFCVGSRLRFADAPDVLVWAENRRGYAHLCRLLTTGKRRAEKGSCLLHLDDLLQSAEGLLAALVPRGIDPELPEPDLGKIESAAGPLKDAFGRRLSLTISRLYGPTDPGKITQAESISRAYGIPLLATNQVHYHDPGRHALQDVLACVRHKCTIHEAGFRLFPNGERFIKSPQDMHHLFHDLPAALRRSVEISERCQFSLDELKYEYPDEIVPEGKTTTTYLAELTWSGAADRYPEGLPEKVRRQIDHELVLIEQLKIEPYFLTVYDLVKFARSRDILCQGRGSAANSAVCYCLGVTSVDPNRIDVLFERFVSAARDEPPDIDIDFEHERREEVIQYLYDKYGRDRAGMTAEVISYRGRSAVRDVGKALGLGLDAVDSLAKRIEGWHGGVPLEPQIREAGLDPNDRAVKQTIELTKQVLGFPRHLSQHVGGMVMTRGPLCELVPIENASMKDRTVVEWDKDDIDAVGILKVDALALGMLTALAKSLRMINDPLPPLPSGEGRGEGELRETSHAGHSCGTAALGCVPPQAEMFFDKYPSQSESLSIPPHPNPLPKGEGKEGPLPLHKLPIQLHTIPAEDPVVYDMISDADTIGVFQVESRAQMSMLPRLKPRKFYDLVIEVAIVRPGPIQGDMVHPYLRRRDGIEPVEFPKPELEQVLGKTLGVPLFQEQAMKVAMVAAGFSAGEADQLRRAMAAWRFTGSVDKFQHKMINGMLANGYTLDFAERCFNQIKGFGEYGFPESHAASFALLVYASSWVKRYYPAAFCAALLNSQPMGFYAPAQLVRDAREHGVQVRPVDVNFSHWDCTLETPDPSPAPPDHRKHTWGFNGPAVRLGFRMIKGFSESHANRIVASRPASGFETIDDFHARTSLPVAAVTRLSNADAFGSLPRTRRMALWETLGLSDERRPLAPAQPGTKGSQAMLPLMSMGEEIRADYASAGLSLKGHPVGLFREELNKRHVTTAADVVNKRPGGWIKVAGLVIIRQRPGTAKGIVFATLEDETGIVNIIIRPDVYDLFRATARSASMIQADGYLERQGKVIHVMAVRLHDLSSWLAEYDLRSRDFH